MKRVLMLSAVLSVLAGPAFAFDYVKEVLIGNTVELTDNIKSESARFHFNADKTVKMLRPGKPDETGSWREDGTKLCTTFPSNGGAEVCQEKPAQATVPGEASFKGTAPNNLAYDITVKWIKDQVGY